MNFCRLLPKFRFQYRIYFNASSDSKNRSQKSLNSGRSIFLSDSLLAASTLTYSWVTGRRFRICSGNCAFVTRNEEMPFPCSKSTKRLISGYIIGSPTKLNAQCLISIASFKRSGSAPGTPTSNKMISTFDKMLQNLDLIRFLMSSITHFTFHLLDHLQMLLDDPLKDRFRIVFAPFPFGSHGIRVMPPTENAFVRAGQTRRRFHTTMRSDPVKCVLIATTPATKHRLRPSAQFHSRM